MTSDVHKATLSPAPKCSICNDLRVTPERGTWFSRHLADITNASHHSCRACNILLHAVKPYQSTMKIYPNEELCINVYMDTLGVPGSTLMCRILGYMKSSSGGHSSKRIVATLEISTSNGKNRREMNKITHNSPTLLTSTGCPYQSITTKKAVSGDTGSAKAIAQVTNWLQHCSSQHPNCRGNSRHQDLDLPARLIEIDKSAAACEQFNVKLVVPTRKDIRYACLSHCWGTRPILQTRRNNMERFFEKIPWTDLPLTFREAVTATFRLDIRHIWIDSLCICQDDTEDWRREGGKMQSIYTGGYLTLAASGSQNADEGLFVDSFANTSRSMKWSAGPGVWDIHVRESFEHASFDSTDMPLQQRAWAFQERVLSCRIVYFTSTELLWECMEQTTCECTRLRYHVPTHRCKHVMTPRENRVTSMTHWHELIQEYTTKRLTYEKDIFPALQGIAKRMQGTSYQSYHAGIWSTPFGLLWYTRDPTRTRRPQLWRAPSWSWASVCGGVAWPESEHGWSHWWDDDVAAITHISTQPAGEDPFGELTGGALRIKGHCAEGALVYHLHTDKDGTQRGITCLVLGADHEAHERSLSCELDFGIPMPEQHLTIPQPPEVPTLLGRRHDLYRDACSASCRNTRSWRVRHYEDILVMHVARDPDILADVYLALKCVDGSRREYERFGIASSILKPHLDHLETTKREITVI